MVYEAFQAAIMSKLKERLGQSCQIQIQKVPKNNGMVLDGFCISKKGENIAPTIYLNSYYEQFEAGASVDELAKEIASIYENTPSPWFADVSLLSDFSKLKDKVAYKLIHTYANRELLKDIPSIPYLDLSIVFYLFLEKTEFGQMTALIHNHHLTMWNTTPEELYKLAAQNTPLLFPADLKTMAQVMSQIACQEKGGKAAESFMDSPETPSPAPLYVLTNRSGLSGACAILYPQVLKNLSHTLNQDLVILPSSIHEVLLVPYDSQVSLKALSDMVNQINHAEVLLEERLSNHVYFYSRQADEILILQDSVSPYLS